jgi:hypothetical protein
VVLVWCAHAAPLPASDFIWYGMIVLF